MSFWKKLFGSESQHSNHQSGQPTSQQSTIKRAVPLAATAAAAKQIPISNTPQAPPFTPPTQPPPSSQRLSRKQVIAKMVAEGENPFNYRDPYAPQANTPQAPQSYLSEYLARYNLTDPRPNAPQAPQPNTPQAPQSYLSEYLARYNLTDPRPNAPQAPQANTLQTQQSPYSQSHITKKQQAVNLAAKQQAVNLAAIAAAAAIWQRHQMIQQNREIEARLNEMNDHLNNMDSGDSFGF